MDSRKYIDVLLLSVDVCDVYLNIKNKIFRVTKLVDVQMFTFIC